MVVEGGYDVDHSRYSFQFVLFLSKDQKELILVVYFRAPEYRFNHEVKVLPIWRYHLLYNK